MSVNGATQRKLTDCEAAEIRTMFFDGKHAPRDIAYIYEVSETAIWMILRHQTYRSNNGGWHNALISHYQYDFSGSDDLRAWAERVTQKRHQESVARALGGR